MLTAATTPAGIIKRAASRSAALRRRAIGASGDSGTQRQREPSSTSSIMHSSFSLRPAKSSRATNISWPVASISTQ